MASKKVNFQKNSLVVLLAITAVLAFLVIMFIQKGNPVSEAARGTGGGKGGHVKPPTVTATITLDQTDVHLGDWVTFTVNTGSTINVMCGKLGAWVYTANQPIGTAFLLGGTSSPWLSQGGPQECYAYLMSGDVALTVAIFFAGGAR